MLAASKSFVCTLHVSMARRGCAAVAQTRRTTTEMFSRTRRTGVLGIKCGMTSEWDQWGVRHPLTIIKVDACKVVQVKGREKEGYVALQVGIGEKKLKRVTKPLWGHFNAANVEPKQHLGEFVVTEDAVLPVGSEIFAAHFVPGQKVDVCGTSIGKGFAGVMKRWNFGGGRASHGNSKAHRSAGSTGQCQDPGRVFPGKKMAGHLGNERVTVKNLEVYRVDVPRNLLFVRGQVPGSKGGIVRVTDARTQPSPPLPFPTIYLEELAELPTEYISEQQNRWLDDID